MYICNVTLVKHTLQGREAARPRETPHRSPAILQSILGAGLLSKSPVTALLVCQHTMKIMLAFGGIFMHFILKTGSQKRWNATKMCEAFVTATPQHPLGILHTTAQPSHQPYFSSSFLWRCNTVHSRVFQISGEWKALASMWVGKKRHYYSCNNLKQLDFLQELLVCIVSTLQRPNRIKRPVYSGFGSAFSSPNQPLEYYYIRHV